MDDDELLLPHFGKRYLRAFDLGKLALFRVEKLIVAVPVGAPSSCRELEAEVDELVCPYRPPAFHAVGAHYAHFEQTQDEEVVQLLADARGQLKKRHVGCVRAPSVTASHERATRR